MILSPPARPVPWLRATASLLVAVVLLAACGGGTSQQEPFVAQRVFAFGDETSTITELPVANGFKYSTNGVDADGVADCRLEPIWVQSLAAQYGFVFEECNPAGLTPRASTFADAGATVFDLVLQVEVARITSGGFVEGDLATVLAGTNDIIQLYRRFPAEPIEALLDAARARGKLLARGVVNRLVDLGAKVIVSDVPNVGLTPFALAERAAHDDVDRADLLTQLTTAFNEQLGVNILIDGRFIGLVQADLQFRAIVQSPGSLNVTEGACTEPLPLCTTATLVPGASSFGYLWADDVRPSSFGHSQLATLAIARALNNPF